MTRRGRKDLKESLIARVYSEGYCCMHGYLTLCQARGETPKSMAANLNFSEKTLRYHFLRMKKGERPCQNKSDCLSPLIEEFKIEKALASTDKPE